VPGGGVGVTVVVFVVVSVDFDGFSTFASFVAAGFSVFASFTGSVFVVFAAFIVEPVDVLVVFGADAAFIGFCVETGFIIFGVETGFIALGEVAGFIPFGCIAAAGFMVVVVCGEVVGCCGFAPPRPWSAVTTMPIVRNSAVNPSTSRVRCMFSSKAGFCSRADPQAQEAYRPSGSR
jgi:hypothetical protein